MKPEFQISLEVKKALHEKRPVVALESTIISHGMPYPDNVKMAKEVEDIIRKEGAVPATIAILNGVIKVGLSEDEIEYLAKAKNVYKVGKRDFGYVISQKKMGATTVSGTSLIANLAGIKVFATGGIGGVHRGAQETFDISRDLEELSELDITVICAGAKSILDLGLTMEYLETKGVEVIGYQTDQLPAFYSRTSGFKVNYRLDQPEEIASLMQAKWGLGLRGGIVVANPIPEAYSMDHHVIDEAIEKALLEANEKGVRGQDVTPFLLSRIKDITGGDSLESNIELVYNNARLAAQIARFYAKGKTSI
ncbi:MAG: pseudouridine-5-phosphate glycosidase [Tenericutes bacterium GWC2_34_14]|nr:MAG: pseudouridine-5-phosphate glycosidase [Tenericutes bacterium GWA2_35_7]OHE29815.1 MAG: pseudouridine-5-phosphate glycosidase [Tenericutes bacterium GWC2_34_14]OHE34794.1 MAG: pseudouridine-5-phosphate glycosidase [Tenericutes bacterium GWE2_34_108]OHE37345.1 MAG: pseudouridine-5-phosphate glycosidase [Tenericutes bacterium GWF1_35_14]OHE39522.1 MAG: pseudouridine-5-phosphate glycosidase [Tenericutes bacterium GWF2_35_184]OHE41934.1 MAG: pseudouridine-5-phosphate glycosidase [Tenericute